MMTQTNIHKEPSEADRRMIRKIVRLPATLSGSTIKRHAVTITDITLVGCRIDAGARYLVGSRMMITLPSMAPVGGRVVWYHDGVVGFEFDRAFHEAVLTTILANFEQPEPQICNRAKTLADFG